MTNYFSLSRHTNYPLIRQTMNGNVLIFHVGFWVTLTASNWRCGHSTKNIFYFFSVFKKNKGLQPYVVNYKTIKTCLKIHIYRTEEAWILWQMTKAHSKVQTEKRRRKKKRNTLSIVKVKYCPLAASDLCMWFIHGVYSHSNTFVVQQQRDWNILFFYLIKQNTCCVTWELAL